MQSFSFSTKNIIRLTNIPDTPFTFYAGSKKISTTRIIAAFLSPSLSECDEFHFSDAVSPEIAINIISAALDGKTVTFKESDLLQVYAAAKELCNSELAAFAEPFSVITFDTVFDLIEKRNSLAVKFFIENFKDLQPEKIAKVSVKTLSAIKEEQQFKEMYSEDELLAVLFAAYETVRDSDAEFSLFTAIDFSAIPRESLSYFIANANLKMLNNGVWDSLKDVLLETLPEPKLPEIQPDFYENVEFTEVKGEMIQKLIAQGVKIEVSASSTITARMAPQNVLLPHNKLYFFSENKPNQWLQLTFPCVVRVDRYDLIVGKSWGDCPYNWSLETSNDGSVWRTVDERHNTDVRSEHETFELKKPAKSKMFRILQTGPNTHDGDDLLISVVRFYGGYEESK